MMLSWVIEGYGAGHDTVRDTDHAAQVLANALRAVYAKESTEAVALILLQVLAPLRAELVTDGAYALARGREWTAQRGGLMVRLVP